MNVCFMCAPISSNLIFELILLNLCVAVHMSWLLLCLFWSYVGLSVYDKKLLRGFDFPSISILPKLLPACPDGPGSGREVILSIWGL